MTLPDNFNADKYNTWWTDCILAFSDVLLNSSTNSITLRQLWRNKAAIEVLRGLEEDHIQSEQTEEEGNLQRKQKWCAWSANTTLRKFNFWDL